MDIKKHVNFKKQYKKLSDIDKNRVDQALEKFIENPTHPSLRNHALKGKDYEGLRSIDAAFDLRIIFFEEGDYKIVILLQVGTHSQLY